jgi:hypothetical protein
VQTLHLGGASRGYAQHALQFARLELREEFVFQISAHRLQSAAEQSSCRFQVIRVRHKAADGPVVRQGQQLDLQLIAANSYLKKKLAQGFFVLNNAEPSSFHTTTVTKLGERYTHYVVQVR